MLSSITRFLRDEEGATAIEYGIIAGLISVAIVAILPGLGDKLAVIFTKISTALTSAGTATPAPGGGS
ncbi:pilus assembly protein Flp/PilA [Variovorax boronicumulans]|uniref:Flp family type IVb pilin n=1 Tax=Variovorax boronicumulans TaxID=436515 RepID=UPI002788A8F4|nr:Flp family type IVb pilin [Variovorax boronicumulans]MDQ0014245.1 pilus assembly protein Flp/PilA [Variovorax boronicumulans]